jgi:hypothetical protein
MQQRGLLLTRYLLLVTIGASPPNNAVLPVDRRRRVVNARLTEGPFQGYSDPAKLTPNPMEVWHFMIILY